MQREVEIQQMSHSGSIANSSEMDVPRSINGIMRTLEKSQWGMLIREKIGGTGEGDLPGRLLQAGGRGAYNV